jgi:hypothetical protein
MTMTQSSTPFKVADPNIQRNELFHHCSSFLIQHNIMAVPEEQRYSGTTFAVQEEDHTLANAVRFFLNKK